MRPLIGCLITVVALFALQAGVWPAAAPESDIWTLPPLSEAEKARERTTSADMGNLPKQISPFQTVKMLNPKPDAVVKEVVELEAEGVDRGGYVVFRIDGNFAYATAAPYKMRWDTTGAEDGPHLVSVSGYNANRDFAGTSAVTVNVKNRIEGGIPPEGLNLNLEVREGISIVRNVEGQSELMGLTPGVNLPKQLLGLDGRLYARYTQSLMSINPITGGADVRTNMRSGVLSSGGTDSLLSERGRFGVADMLPSGLLLPPARQSKRPRIGLAEVSLALPIGKVAEGATWESPMRVVPSLSNRNSIEVNGLHRFEGLWWLKGRKCARISSSYEIGDVALSSRLGGLIAQAPSTGQEMELVLTGMPGGRSFMRNLGRGGAGAARRGTAGANLPAARTPAQQRQQRTTETQAEPEIKTIVAAKLSGLYGNRLTWIDIDQGIVVRTEDHIRGTLVVAERKGGTAPVASLPDLLESNAPAAGNEMAAGSHEGYEIAMTGAPRGGRGGGGRMGRPGGRGGSGGGRGGRGRAGGRGRGGSARRGTGPYIFQNPWDQLPGETADLSASQRLPYRMILVVEIAE